MSCARCRRANPSPAKTVRSKVNKEEAISSGANSKTNARVSKAVEAVVRTSVSAVAARAVRSKVTAIATVTVTVTGIGIAIGRTSRTADTAAAAWI